VAYRDADPHASLRPQSAERTGQRSGHHRGGPGAHRRGRRTDAFHVGLFAEHERPPLEMEDDPENPEWGAAKPLRRRHEFKNLYAGEHEPL
jgi:hypothetical protein